MKKLIIFFLIIICFILSINLNSTFSFYDFFDNYEILSYTKNKVDNDSIFCGHLYITKTNSKNENLQGESFECSANDFKFILNKLKAIIVNKEQVNNLIIIYAFSNKIDKCVYLSNKKVNLQFAFDDETLTVGWPLILGSF